METGRKIVAAVDESEISAAAFTWALHNIVRQNDHIVVLTVAPFASAELPSADLVGEYGVSMVPSVDETKAMEKQVMEESKKLITKYLNQCLEKNLSCEGEVVKGEPGSWIIDEASRIVADIIVVGSHSYGVVKRTIIGSISDYVLHNANCAVAIVRHSETVQPGQLLEGPRKVVIAVDESKEAVYAFSWALQNFCKTTDKVIIYHVNRPAATPITAVGTGEFGMEDVYVPPGGGVEDDVESLKESEKLVEKFMKHASEETQITCEGMVVTGPTEAKVCEGLSSLKADVVIVGSHNRGTIARTFLGSVSDYLSHHSPCPLIVAKIPKDTDVASEEQHQHDP